MSKINNVVTGQLVSTIATGTAPFSVASTTQVNNLKANKAASYPTPFQIGYFSGLGDTIGAVTLTEFDCWAQTINSGSGVDVVLPTAKVGRRFCLVNAGTGTATIKQPDASTTLSTRTTGQWCYVIAKNDSGNNWVVAKSG